MTTRAPIIAAIKCFDENRNLHGKADTKPEKYNLYNGLSNLAEAVYELQKQMETLSQDVRMLRMNI